MNGSSGSDISFDAHQRERGVAALLDVAAEVFDQLLAALAGIDPSAVEGNRTVEPVPAAEDGAAREQM